MHSFTYQKASGMRETLCISSHIPHKATTAAVMTPIQVSKSSVLMGMWVNDGATTPAWIISGVSVTFQWQDVNSWKVSYIGHCTSWPISNINSCLKGHYNLYLEVFGGWNTAQWSVIYSEHGLVKGEGWTSSSHPKTLWLCLLWVASSWSKFVFLEPLLTTSKLGATAREESRRASHGQWMMWEVEEKSHPPGCSRRTWESRSLLILPVVSDSACLSCS